MRERCFGKIFNYIILCLSLVSAKDADANLITKLDGVLTTNMSSVAFNWTSENAVDGNIGPDPELCLCCSGTTYSTTSWWTLDLGKMYPIEKVAIYSRESENKIGQLKGFLLLLRNSTEQTNQLFYDDSTTTTTDTSVFDILLSNVLARYLTIQRAGILTICEVEVFEGDCMIGTFGEECSKQCHCADNRICDRLIGQCSTPVCKIGWIGTACDRKCKADAFGENCREKCYCAGNTTCTIDYGICPGNCRKGYFGIHCNKVCPDGAFGTNCNHKCFCDGNETCSKDEGICPGTCIAGYTGMHCNIKIAEKSEKPNLSMIIGVSAGGGVVVIVAITLFSVCFYRRRSQNGNGKSEFIERSQGKTKSNAKIGKKQIEIRLVENPTTQPMNSKAGVDERAEDENISVMVSSNDEETAFKDSNSTTSEDSSVSNQDTVKDVNDADKSNETNLEISIDSQNEGVQNHTKETDIADISKSDSTFEAEKNSNEKRYVSLLKPGNIYQYYNMEIKRQMKKDGVEELELEEDNIYEPVGEPVGDKLDETEEKAVSSCVIRRDRMNKVLGKLWGETPEVIKIGVLELITPPERHLLETKFEIITSEASYLKSINVLIDVFMMSDMFRYESSTQSMVDKQTHDLIFSNITEIRETSERFLEELESNWKRDVYLSDVCKIVADHAKKNFKCYIDYCSTQHVQSRTIQELRQNSDGFDKELKQLEKLPACQKMNMLSFLLLPMQRITRLRLLTESVHKKTTVEKGNNDDMKKDASRAHKNIANVNKRCNRAALMKQGEDATKRAANEIEFPDQGIKIIPIDEKSRYLVRDEDVTRIVNGKGGKVQLEVLHLYIFNDIAVLTKKMKKKGSMHTYTVLDYCKLLAVKAESIHNIKDEKYKKILQCDIPKGLDKFLLRLIILENHEEEHVEWILSCKDQTDKDKWMEIIAPIAGDEDDQRIYTDLDSPLVQCIVKYTAQDDDELSLEESDEVRVIRKIERIGMYYGERLEDLEEGWFPKDHIIEIEDEHVLQRQHLLRYLLKHEYGEDE